MFGRIHRTLLVAATAVVVIPAAGLHGQERFRVLIPNFQPLEGADKKFGENAAKDLRELVAALATHQSIDKKEIETNLKRFKMKWEDLDCVRTRQLAAQINAQVALCASYSGTKDAYTVDAAFWDVSSSEVFEVDQTTAGEKQDKEAAQHIFSQFDQYQQQVRAAAICSDYAGSQQWDAALRNCDEALQLNPSAVGTRYLKARILFDSDRHPESLEELKKVLELNAFHEDALQLAGYISAKQGEDDEALAYYSQYLELNPGSAAVRMKIAYDLAQAGDPRGAMHLIQEGMDVDPENIDLIEQFGGFAFAAGQKVQAAAGDSLEDAGAVPPEAAGYYRQAIEAYKKVFAAKGAATPVSELRSIIAAHIQLGELEDAIVVAGQALETHPQEDAIWSMYADALQRTGKLDDAISALDHASEIDPTNITYGLRKGKWLVEAGRVDDAVAMLKTVASADPKQAETAARMIFADAYANGVQKNRYDYAIRLLAAAKQMPNLGTGLTQQLNFWHGYSIYQAALAEQKPATLATANATLPKFKEALRLLQQAGDYPRTVNVNMEQFLTGVNTYIEIQDAIIKRGR
jgi:tetratricopeptide (TPR) repeat protein